MLGACNIQCIVVGKNMKKMHTVIWFLLTGCGHINWLKSKYEKIYNNLFDALIGVKL